MAKLKLFGCNDFYAGGKIIAIITLVENFMRSAISVIFLLYTLNERETLKLKKGEFANYGVNHGVGVVLFL